MAGHRFLGGLVPPLINVQSLVLILVPFVPDSSSFNFFPIFSGGGGRGRGKV